MREHNYILFLLFFVLLSCSKDHEPEQLPEQHIHSLAFAYASTVAPTRTVAALDVEKAIYDMDIFAFHTDGTFVAHLASDTDYEETTESGTTTINVSDNFLIENVGNTLVFYFVANNKASMPVGSNHTDHLGVSSLTATQLENSLTLTNDRDPNEPDMQEIIWALANWGPGWQHGLLMTAKSAAIRITGKQMHNISLVRRTARFDIYNPEPESYTIEKLYIADAPEQGQLFGTGIYTGTIPTRSIAPFNGPFWWSNPEYSEYDTDNVARGFFYMYPCTMGGGATEIAILVKRKSDNMQSICTVVHTEPITITANKCYTLVFEPATLSFIFDGNDGDWYNGGGIGG